MHTRNKCTDPRKSAKSQKIIKENLHPSDNKLPSVQINGSYHV